MEWSSAVRLVINDSKVTFRINCRAVRRYRVSVLYTLLSIGLWLYCHLFRACRFSVTNVLIYRGCGTSRWGPWSGDGVDAHATSWIRYVSVLTASSTSSGVCSGMSRRSLSTMCVWKTFQLVVCDESGRRRLTKDVGA